MLKKRKLGMEFSNHLRTFLVIWLHSLLVTSQADWHFTGNNIALGKRTEQSPSVYKAWNYYRHEYKLYTADLAVDGNTNTYFEHGSCSHTEGSYTKNASWTVYFGQYIAITGIVIFNRHDHRDRLRNFVVIGSANNANYVLYNDNGHNNYQYLKIEIPLDGKHLYSSITIQIPTHYGAPDGGMTFLTLCEVEVYAAPHLPCARVNPPQNGLAVIYKATGTTNYMIPVGTIIKFSCNENYKLKGSTFIECLTSGHYNGSAPTCQIVTCEGLETPEFGQLQSTDKSNAVNTELTVLCNKGYQTSSQNRTIRCQSNGEWSGTLPLCLIVQCNYPGKLDNGFYEKTTLPNEKYEASFLPYLSSITAVCNPGFTSDNIPTRICLSDSSWSSTNFSCNLVFCMFPGSIKHGIYILNNGSKYVSGIVPYNTVLNITCEVGYNITGQKQRRCMGNKRWSNMNAACLKVVCQHPDRFQNGAYSIKSTNSKDIDKFLPLGAHTNVTYSMRIYVQCTEGTILKSRNSSRTCLATGMWSGETPLCIPVMCTWPLPLNGGHYIPSTSSSGSGMPYNTTLEATCYPKFNLSYNYRSRRCNGNGDWENEPAVCEPLCALPNVTNADKTKTVSTVFKIGSSVRVICKSGYTLSPDEHIMCEDNHEWSGAPECLAISKSDEQVSTNNAVIGGVSATVVVVLVAVGVLAVFLFRRRQYLLQAKLQSAMANTNNISVRAEWRSGGSMVFFDNDYGYNQDNNTEQNHTYNNTSIRPPVISSVGSSVSLQPDQAYYTFTNEKKKPKTAIRVEDLSDLLLTVGRSKQDFENQFKSLPQGMSEPHTQAIKLQNRGKNRYKNLYAYDETRVVLEKDDASQSDYINACYVHGFSKTRRFIASQGPTKEILDDFWKMVWQEDCSKIVMLTNLFEEGKTKCEQYWPDERSHQYGQVTVTIKSTETFSQFLIRRFTIEKDNLHSKTITQFHFTAWPDKGVPKYASSLVHFLTKVRYAPSAGNGPIVVHCSAGVGRTGTFIALDNLTDQGKMLGYVDVAGMVASLRTQRVSLVQTLEQYIFLHHALVEALMLSTSALPATKFPEAFNELLQVDNTKKKKKICLEFETLRKMSPVADECQYVSSKQVRNRQKNRYSNVLPVDEFVPALTSVDRSRDTDYINAVFLPSYKEQKAFIITQAPLESTKEDFWRLVWEHDVHTIVMMNNKLEIKEPEVYWSTEGEQTTFGNIVVTNDGSEEINKHHVLSLTVKKHLVTRYIKIVQCVGWQPRKSLPDSPEVILSLMEIVQIWQQQTGNHTTIVHCLNGADKSGLYCVISAVIERMKIEQDVAISQVIEEMRNAREQIIPSVEQYQFCHELVLAFMGQYDTYSNFSS